MILEPSMRELVLNLLAEENCYVTVKTGTAKIHGEIARAKVGNDVGWLVGDYENHIFIKNSLPILYSLEIRFKLGGQIVINYGGKSE